jgi:hypothetical protein
LRLADQRQLHNLRVFIAARGWDAAPSLFNTTWWLARLGASSH